MTPVTERINLLESLGLQYDSASQIYVRKDIVISLHQVKTVDDSKFNNLASQIKQRIEQYSDYYAAEQIKEVVKIEPSKEEDDKEVAMFIKSAAIFQSAPDVLKTNKTSIAAAKAAIIQFIEKVNANGGKLNEALDTEANNLLVKIRSTIKSVNERRSPFTQLATALSKQFTTLEAELDISKAGTLSNQVQKLRDDWALWCHEEAERKKREAAELLEKEKQKTDLHATILQKIGECLVNYIFNKKSVWNKSFNAITLADFEVKAAHLKNAVTQLNPDALLKIVKYDMPFTKLSAEESGEIQAAAWKAYDFATWITTHNTEMADLKRSLVDRLPSKKTELQEAADAERKRQEELARQQEEERKRQEEIARANTEERERLQKEAEEKRRQDAERREQLEREAREAEQEKKRREDEEQKLLLEQKEKDEKKAKEAANLAAAALSAQNMFDSVVMGADTPTAPSARTGYEIEVKHHAGWVEIFQLWYQNKGVSMPLDEMGKVSLDKMKKYAEDMAKDGGEKINSKFLIYNTSSKAINRKK